MSVTPKLHLSFQEGPAINYFKEVHKKLGGSYNDNNYSINSAQAKIRIDAFDDLEGFQVVPFNLYSTKPIIVDRTPDDNPNIIHLNIIKQGMYNQLYQEESTSMQANTPKGIFIYNGLFPITIEIPPMSEVKILGFKIDISNKNILFKDTVSILKQMFDSSDKGFAYHTNLSHDIERLVEDIFYYNNLKRGRTPMVLSRSIEVFTNLGLILEKLNENDELNGLHIEDFQRINLIKEKLVNSFDKKVIIEDLADEYGVSVSKLKRDFKALLGTSIYQFYTDAKMDEAYRRLKSGEYTVSEIGYDLGYSNLSKFSEMFKKTKGLSPKDVLKRKE